MYLTEFLLENTGPFGKCHVKLPFSKEGNPLPVIVVAADFANFGVIVSILKEFVAANATALAAQNAAT